MKLTVTAFVICLLGIFLSVGMAGEKAEKAASHDYVGVNKCKLCHKKDGTYESWMETKHAKAWESLKPEDQKNEKCVACHTTGTDAKGELLTGIQCEACHGPGADYKKKSIMEDKKLAMANGLLMPDENTCKKCHNENVPAQFQPKEGYDFAKMMKTGVHAHPAKEEAKEGAKEGK